MRPLVWTDDHQGFSYGLFKRGRITLFYCYRPCDMRLKSTRATWRVYQYLGEKQGDIQRRNGEPKKFKTKAKAQAYAFRWLRRYLRA